MYSNLIGCDGERVYYDGCCVIAINGEVGCHLISLCLIIPSAVERTSMQLTMCTCTCQFMTIIVINTCTLMSTCNAHACGLIK